MQKLNFKHESSPARCGIAPARGKQILACALLFACCVPAMADGMVTTNTDSNLSKLADMDISQLMQVKVSILGPSQSVSRTPAAVSVVTQDDIKRSGARNFPEALRLVPGMDVAQVDASQWAVSARGFNDTFANKLLVMQDGRSIYTPLFSGVFWDVQGTMMEDIEHIEVVRGPGATLWGANAMNGVINIITKNAEHTQGLLTSAGGGNQDRGFAEARYGGAINSNAFYRVYGMYENHASTDMTDGSSADNSWQLVRGGFRTDWNSKRDNTFTFQGDGYAGWFDQVFGILGPPPTYTTISHEEMKAAGGNVLGRWTRDFSDTSNLKLQAYYDYTDRNAPDFFDEQRHTFDLDLKHQFALNDLNKIVCGLGYRLTVDSEQNSPTTSFNPSSETLNLFNGFAQDELAIVKDRLSLTFGTKLEHNDYTGFEVEPGARLLWTPTSRQTFWASVSRAVRTPSRAEETVRITQAQQVPPPAPPGIYVPVTISGTDSFDSEDMIAYEIGYRAAPVDHLSLDVTAFYNDYNHLRSEQQSPGNLTQFYVGNALFGRTYGFEATATWQVTEQWRLQPTYSMLQMDFYAHPENGYTDHNSVAQIEGASPQNQFSLRSSLDLAHGVTFDTALRYVDNLPYFNIDSYFELNARLAWQINKNLEVSLVGQNLLHDRHAEFGPTVINTQNGMISEIPRSFYAQITWRF